MPPPMTIAVRTVVMLSPWVSSVRAYETDLGGNPVILVVAASGRVPAQVSVRGRAPAGCWRTPPELSVQSVVSGALLVLSASSVSSAGISPVSWKARHVSSPG
ncbi:hypothetical protein GCM10009848_17240 [Micromonospora lupini]